MKNILFILPLLFLTSCKTPCDQSTIVSAASQRLVGLWACQNPDVLKAWFDGIASKVGLCTNPALKAKIEAAPTHGAVASIICPIAIAYLQSEINAQVPPEALCDPNKVGAGAAAALSIACNLIPL